MHLEIVIKTCDVRSLNGEQKERFCNTDKLTLIKKCLSSLVIASNNLQLKVKLNVVDDGSSEECVNAIEKILKSSQHETELYHREKNDFNEATLDCFEKAKDSEALLVYCVEDDYLHFPFALIEMVGFHQHSFNQMNKTKDIIVHPYDDPHNYITRFMDQSHIVLGGQRHWRTNTHTTCTFLTTPGVIRREWELFEKFAKNYGKEPAVDISNTINLAWNKPDVQLFSCIPSLALHMQFQDQMDRMIIWKQLWDMIPDL